MRTIRRYETIAILDPDLTEDVRTGLYDRIRELIPAQDGFVVGLDEWGTRKLAYPIKKKPRGFYLRIDYCGRGAMVDELERTFRIDDRFMKFMTVQTEDNIDLEALKEALAQKEKEAEEAKAAEAAEAEAKAAEEAKAPAEAAAETPETDTAEKAEPETTEIKEDK